MRDDAAYEDALLRAAIDNYSHAYRANSGHYYYSGINALTLMHLARHLKKDARYDHDIATMAGAVRYAAECEPDPNQLFWSRMTLGDLEVLVGTADTVKDAYKEAIARNDKDWFALNSSRAQLQLLQDLGFRPETVAAGIATFDRALGRLTKPEDRWEPRQVLLFSGHRFDAPDRKTPRFPAVKEAAAAQAIEGALERLAPATMISRSAKPRWAATCCSSKHARSAPCVAGCCCPLTSRNSSKNRSRPRLAATNGAIAFTP
jgi:tetratricopeptide (TPR) repeat protein